MAVTLEQLLGDDELGLRLSVPPPQGSPRDISIDWAHGIELIDPRRFLRGGEMVMLTGLRLPRRAADQADYVDRLVEARVAVLGFGIGVQFDTIPRGLLSRCREVGLPLVEIPLRTPFMAVSQHIARQESELQTAPLHDLIGWQQTLSRAAVRDGIPGLVRRAHSALGPVAVYDGGGVLLSSAAPDWFLAEVTGFVQAHRNRSTSGTTVLTAAGGTVIEVHTLPGRQARRGWLAIGLRREPGPTDRLLINQIASLVTLSLDTRGRAVDEQLEATAMAALLLRDPADAELTDILRRLRILDAEEIAVICVSTSGEADLAAAVHQDLAAVSIDHLCRSNRTETLIVVAATDGPATVRRLQLRIAAIGAPVGIGVSAVLPLAHTARGLGPARRSAAAAIRGGVPVVDGSEAAIESLVADPLVADRVRDSTESMFSALDAAADAREGDLVRTLLVYLSHHGKWAAAAEELRIHRHTLYARIKRIEQLTGADLGDARQRALLLLACLARQ